MAIRVGFRLHTGWAMLVAVAVEGEEFCVLHRCRLELLPAGRNRFVYHEAAELPLADAEKLIESVRQAAEESARAAISGVIGEMHVSRACLPAGSLQAPEDLAAVLRSHARIHGAEGALYAAAIASACGLLGIPLVTFPESIAATTITGGFGS